MPRLLQQLLAPLDPIVHPAAAGETADDDFALGWECANPALQFESWEPDPLRAAPAAPSY